MRNNINSNFKQALRVFIIFLIFIVILYARLAFLALAPKIDGIVMDDFAKARNTENKKLYATRGTIYDRDNNILATNVSSYTVIAYLDPSRTTNSAKPNHVVDKDKTADLLAPILNMEKKQILTLLEKEKVYQVELGPGGRDITELKKDEIVNLNLPGIDFIQMQKRNYPNGDFASYVIGYAKRYEEIVKENGFNKVIYNMVGELGVESKYNDLLKGVDGSLIYQRDRFGYKIPDTKEERISPKNGSNIYLTIDANIQRFLEAEVKNASKEYEPEWLQLTVMNAKTGEILGTTSTPSFNPNVLNIENYENPLTSYLFEPGSTMKTFTYMCAIEKGTYKSDETFDSGSINIGGSIVSDWNNHGWGTITFDKGYEYSSNTAIANIVDRFIDKKDLLECFQKYGFGEKTGIELSRELQGDLTFNYDIEIAAAGFGQGITTTAIQHLQALTLIANEGNMIKPYIISKIVDPNTNEETYTGGSVIKKNVVSKQTADKIKELMYNVMYGEDEGTTGRAYKIDGFDIMGKTGTAQIYDNINKRYLSGWNDYIYSFSGIFPKDEPEIIIYGAMKKPNSGQSRGLSIATKNVMKNIAKYLNIFDETTEGEDAFSLTTPSYINKKVEPIVELLSKKGIDVILIGNGDKVINQYPKIGEKLLKGDKIFLVTNGLEIKMPDMISWSRIEVINFSKLVGLNYDIEGYGYVTNQSIKPNKIIDKDDLLQIELQPKIRKEETEETTI